MKYSRGAFQIFSSFFSLICIAAAVFFMVYCTLQYCKNEDSSVVEFAEYNKGKDNIYPGITLCFRGYLKDDTFANNFEEMVYRDFINGNDIFENEQQKLAYIRALERDETNQIPDGNEKQTSNDQENSSKNDNKEKPQKGGKHNASGNEGAKPKGKTRKTRSSNSDVITNNAGKSKENSGFSEKITADQEEIIRNFTRKIEDLYETNDIKNLNDYVLFSTMSTYKPGLRVYHYPSNKSFTNTTWVPVFYPSFSSPRKRCWTFELPYNPMEKIVSYGVMLNKTIFEKTKMVDREGKIIYKRPPYKSFEVRLSYPGQQLTSSTVESNWGRDESKKEYTMKFEVQNIVVMKKRNKLQESCEEDWKNNDNVSISKILQEVKCTLPHWNINTSYTLCQGKQLKKIGSKFQELRNNVPPCQTIEKILYTYTEKDGLENFDETIAEAKKQLGIKYDITQVFQVTLNFQGSTYMEITQIRAYDGQSLIGNAGGYVGLFLGVALIQLPAAILYLFQLTKQLFST